jgi:prevent-host-death family protein
MENISTDDLGKRLTEILERVARGEHFTVTKHGKAAAELGPVGQGVATQAAVETILEIQKRVKPLGTPVREAIEEGRA